MRWARLQSLALLKKKMILSNFILRSFFLKNRKARVFHILLSSLLFLFMCESACVKYAKRKGR